jgi:outer membrane protein
MSEEEQKTEADEIKNLEVRIQEAQQNSQQELAEYDAKLKQPIMDKVKNAITVVSSEAGYTLIFDTSTGAILYAGGDDITDLVKTKLGI